MADIAPMLSILGYDPYGNPPDYGKPDSWVKDNTFKVSWGINNFFFKFVFKQFCFFFCLKVKADEKLWESKAKQLLKRSEPEQDDNSNPDDTDTPEEVVAKA